MIGRNLYPLGVSVLAHLLLLLLFSRFRLPAPSPAPQRRAVLILAASQPGVPRLQAAEVPPAAAPPRLSPAGSQTGVHPGRPVPEEVPVPASLAAIPRPALVREEVPVPAPARERAALRLSDRSAAGLPAAGERPAAFPLPSPQEVFSRLPEAPVLPADDPADVETEGIPPGGPAFAAAEPQIGWKDQARRLLRRREPQFPAKLIQEGLEVEVTARFLVLPSGQVTDVDILHSSGYTLVDHSVIQALREYVFEKSDAAESDAGTVRFTFRLERVLE
jgi:protein TonB